MAQQVTSISQLKDQKVKTEILFTHKRVSTFTRKGKKEKRETLFRRSIPRLGAFGASRTSQSQVQNVVKTEDLLVKVQDQRTILPYATTPFVSLKTRRRGKRIVTKVNFLAKSRGQRKALVALSSSLQESGAVSKSFGERLGKQLDSLRQDSSRGWVASLRQDSPSRGWLTSLSRPVSKTTAKVTLPNTKRRKETDTKIVTGNGIRDTRDELHRQAFSALPYVWRSGKNKKFSSLPCSFYLADCKPRGRYYRSDHLFQGTDSLYLVGRRPRGPKGQDS